MQFGISDQDIVMIQKVMTGYPAIEEVVIYGSRAKGNYKTGSDIDLMIKGTMSREAFHRLEYDLDELMLPYQFDLAMIDTIDNLKLLDHVMRAGKTFYKK